MDASPAVHAPPSGSRPEAGALDPALLRRLLRRDCVADRGREQIPVVAPFSGEVLARIPRGTPADVAEAVRRARAAQPTWAARSIAERARVLIRFHDLLLDRQAEVLDVVQLENGKARQHAWEEMADTAVVARYYAHHADRHLRPRRRRGALPGLTSTWEYHHPIGVVGYIVPWNYPLNLAITDALPALVAGNTVVLKPDHQTSLTALWLVDLLYEAGLPADTCMLVTGEGPELGPTLIDSVDFVMFTGSTQTGKIIARQAAERLVGYSLELGGKNPMIVLADADLEKAVDGAVRGCFVGAGQVCVSIERLYVHASLFDEFARRFVRRVGRLRLGSDLDFGVDMGSLTSARQLERVTEHVRDAVGKGATVLAGGSPRPDLGPFFFEPTVLTGVTPAMRAYTEETFGPVVALYRFETEDEAVSLANATRYGLSASVWTGDPSRGRRIATRIEAGSVNVNDAYAATWASVDAPIGGYKESGVGRRHGAEGILKYTNTQTVAVQRGFSVSGPPWLDTERYTGVMRHALQLMRRIPGLR